MSLPVVIFLAAVVIPVFVGRIRSAPFWLVAQGAALAWVAASHDGTSSTHAVAAVLEALLIRGAVAPWLLRRALRARHERDGDLMPSNLFTWAIALTLIVLAFEFAAPGMADDQSVTLGAVGATVAVALLLLSTNDASPAQLVAVLVMENGLALFESLLPEPWPLPVHAALSGIYVVTVGIGGWLVATPDAHPLPGAAAPEEDPA